MTQNGLVKVEHGNPFLTALLEPVRGQEMSLAPLWMIWPDRFKARLQGSTILK